MSHKVTNKWLGLALVGMLCVPALSNAAADNNKIAGVENKPVKTTNTPVKNEIKKPVREIELVVQRGEKISSMLADVDGDGKEEVVELLGTKIADSTHYKGDIYVLVKEQGTDKIKKYCRPQDLGGYDAYLTAADVTGDGIDDVIIAAPTGGSGGIVDYRILDFGEKEPREIFGREENKGVPFTGYFLPNFQVKLVFPSIDKELVLALPDAKDLYVHLNAYNRDGSLKNSGLRPYTQNLTNLFTLDTNGDGRSDVITTQRVVGVTNVDTIGYVRTKWRYKAGSWQQEKVDFQTTLDSKQEFDKDSVLKSSAGYEVTREDIVVEGNRMSYPHFSKLPSSQQWLVNNQLEEYTKTVLYKVLGKGQALIKYEVPYAGKNFVSILFNGSVIKGNKADIVAESYNFDLNTGEDVPLDKLIKAKGKFWERVTAAGKKENIVINKDNVYNYYFDGENLVLLYSEGKEFGITLTDLGMFLQKGKITDEILTKQSKGVKTQNKEKK